MPRNAGPGAFTVDQIRRAEMGPEIVEYLKRIESTFEPFGGRYVVHGSMADVREGSCDGDLVIIGFPDLSTPSAGTYRTPTGLSGLCAASTRTALW